MNLKKHRVLFIPGNWIGDKILSKIRKDNPGIETIDLIGLTLKNRFLKVKSMLQSNNFDQIIAYSSGCTILAMIERSGLVLDSTKVIYLAPAPQSGISFKISDMMFSKVVKYLPKLIKLSIQGKKLILSKNDFRILFKGVYCDQIVDLLESESAQFMFGQILNQFGDSIVLNNNPNRFIVRSKKDYLLGSTQDKTIKILNGNCLEAENDGHLGPIVDLKPIISKIIEI